MTRADVEPFAIALGQTAEGFGEALSRARVLIYFEDLADLPLDAVLSALRASRTSLKFFPKIAEIREFVIGHPGDRAIAAWSRLVRAIEVVGTGDSVDFGDPALHAAVESMGGWPEMFAFERLDPRELSFRRAEFTKLYMSFLVHPADCSPPILLGHHAIQNALTRGSWTHGLDHQDRVCLLGPTGTPVASRALAPAPPSTLLAGE